MKIHHIAEEKRQIVLGTLSEWTELLQEQAAEQEINLFATAERVAQRLGVEQSRDPEEEVGAPDVESERAPEVDD